MTFKPTIDCDTSEEEVRWKRLSFPRIIAGGGQTV